jgi:hypothetical protein
MLDAKKPENVTTFLKISGNNANQRTGGVGDTVGSQKKGDCELAYQLAIDINKIPVKFVSDRLEQCGTADIPVIRSAELDKLSDSLRQLGTAVEKSSANALLKSL